jgi:hypothetical protein
MPWSVVRVRQKALAWEAWAMPAGVRRASDQVMLPLPSWVDQ